ncbi:hypothetical protein SH661x_002005 [Planctomicrobium sp. SH661]|uniref:hypothetical protein n=1 Tax=Planctomicrobium sp. SH661 TaxID=3448124 RepID=UPI003F5B4586
MGYARSDLEQLGVDFSTLADACFLRWDESAGQHVYQHVSVTSLGAAAATHAHGQSDITGLTAALAAKSDTGHTHTMSGITDLPTITVTPTNGAVPKADGSGKIAVGWLPTGSGNGLDADTLDGVHAAALAALSGATFSGAVKVANTATNGIEVYNTSDQTTNYEKLFIRWISSQLMIGTVFGGTGVDGRALVLGASHVVGGSDPSLTSLTINPTTSSLGFFRFTRSSSVTSMPFISLGGCNGGASSGVQTFFAVNPRIGQSGTAGWTAHLINPSAVTEGSGPKLLLDCQVNDVRKCSINYQGAFAPASIADSAAPSNSFYYSSTQSKLVFKDSGGTAHPLY